MKVLMVEPGAAPYPPVPRRRQRAYITGICVKAAGEGNGAYPHTRADEGTQRVKLCEFPADRTRSDDP